MRAGLCQIDPPVLFAALFVPPAARATPILVSFEGAAAAGMVG